MNYKEYQQVIHLNTRKPKPSKAISRSSIVSPSSGNIKKRTKTGCLTCRKRKKKCDEHTADGKCEACTRNFLECVWPVPLNSVSKKSSSSSTVSDSESIGSPILSCGSPSDSDCGSVSSSSDDEPKYKRISISNILNGTNDYTNNHLHHHQESLKINKFIITSINFQHNLCQVSN